MSGDAVSVSVSGGMAVVPNVYGRHLADAQELIAASGLSLNQNITFLETDDTTMHGLVAQQSPSGGSEVIASAKVSLTLYRVPSMMARAKVVSRARTRRSMCRCRMPTPRRRSATWPQRMLPASATLSSTPHAMPLAAKRSRKWRCHGVGVSKRRILSAAVASTARFQLA